MHLLSGRNRDEFLAVPQLVRFDYIKNKGGMEPTLLIKGNSLLLKYVVLGARLQLAFTKCDDRLLYGLRVFDDTRDDGIIWSVAEREKELDAIRGLVEGQPLVAFLFNEIVVNVAWNDFPDLEVRDSLSHLIQNVKLGAIDQDKISRPASILLEQLRQPDNDWVTQDIGGRNDWKPLCNHFITAKGSSSLIDLFNTDEGNQQEQIGIWLTDNLQPSGAYHSPQRPHKGIETRELTDILLSHEFGAILIESKTLSIMTRERLPDRAKLKRDVSGHITKAFKQLRGGTRQLRDGAEISTLKGDVLSIEREHPAHAIVLIPDLDLIENKKVYGQEFINNFIKDTGAFPHLLDIAELLRVIQAAEMISSRDTTTTLMMALDYYLLERIKKASEVGTLCIEVLLRIVEEEPRKAR